MELKIERPSVDCELDLKRRLDQIVQDAAKSIVEADFILFATGAGFSADSGLPTYNEIREVEGMEYAKLCQPHLLQAQPRKFYSFWGNWLNLCRTTEPHEGYLTVLDWKRRMFDGSERSARTRDIQAGSRPPTKPIAPDHLQLQLEKFIAEQADLEKHTNDLLQLIMKDAPSGGSLGKRYRSSNENDNAGAYQQKRILFEPQSSDLKTQIEVDGKSNSSSSYTSKSGHDTQWPLCSVDVEEDNRQPAGSFFCVTSNVDGHMMRVGMRKQELWEVHGSVERWQCSNSTEGERRPSCSSQVWKMQDAFRFPKTVESSESYAPQPENQLAQASAHKGPTSQSRQGNCGDVEAVRVGGDVMVSCPHCLGPARPAIKMFQDDHFIEDVAASSNFRRWTDAVVSQMRDDPRLKLVVLEVGCGVNVPTIRSITHSFLLQFDPCQTSLIRINPEYPCMDEDKIGTQGRASTQNMIPVMSNAVSAIAKIEQVVIQAPK